MLEWNGNQMRNNFTQVHALLQFISISNFISTYTTFLTNDMPFTDRIKWTFSEERYVAGCCVQKTTNVEKHLTRSLSQFDGFCFNSLHKELYLAANPKVSGSDGEVCIIGTRTGNINHKTGKKSDNKTNNPNDQAKP